jgi:tRNA-specific 2-thiouridylase
VPSGKYVNLIDKLRPQGALAGDIVHVDGRVLGRHEGVSRYTIGQRRGLNVAVGDPLFVVRIDAAERQVIVGPREALLTRSLTLKEINWLGDEPSLLAAEGKPVLARVRSTREPAPARLVNGGVVFDAPEEGVAPGQACVLYAPASAASRVLGGGFIAETVAAA